MGREFELKYRANAYAVSAICEKFGGFTPITMATEYYDTPSRQLSCRHWTLRRRFENGVSVCTLKTPCPDGGRSEWEVNCPDIREAIDLLCAAGAPITLVGLTAGGLEQVCAARFTRLAKTLELPGVTLELALDRGSLLGGGREEPLCEVEVELKSGDEQACVAFAQSLAQEFSLVPESDSKYARALALARKEREHG